MNFSKLAKVLLGLLTLIPLPYMVVFNFILFPRLKQGLISFYPLFWIQGAVLLLVFGLVVFCVRQTFSNPKVPSDKKALWAVALVLGNMLAVPIFYWHYIWPAHAGDQNNIAS